MAISTHTIILARSGIVFDARLRKLKAYFYFFAVPSSVRRALRGYNSVYLDTL
jgi:hypothetical protein